MICLPLFPVWIVDILGSGLVIFLAWRSFQIVRRAMARAPENAMWLFLFWLTLALFGFALFRSMGHIFKHLLVFTGHGAIWARFQPVSGGLNSIIFVIIAAVSLFFYHIQGVYQRMMANHYQMEITSQGILELNRQMEALVIERTMSEMALGMADGIRNPLHIIGGFSHRLLRKTDPDDPARIWATAIVAEAKRLELLVERFEALAQKKEAFFSREDLNTIVQETLSMLQLELENRQVRMVTELYPRPIMGRLNQHLLKIALAHLLRNSIEATAPQGEIRVTTSIEKEQATLVIKDTGRGMPAKVVDQVFRPFYTTKIGGTGLGMVYVRQIVDEHRGVISLKSKEGIGTVVTIKLPLRFAEAEEMTQKSGDMP
jgi:signal transduction histidine kinase